MPKMKIINDKAIVITKGSDKFNETPEVLNINSIPNMITDYIK